MTRKIEDRRRKRQQEGKMVGWHHRLNGCLSKFWEIVKDREAWSATVHGVTKGWT